MLELHVDGHIMGMNAPAEEPMREDEEEEEEREGVEEDRRKGSCSTGDVALVQAPTLQWAMPVVPEF